MATFSQLQQRVADELIDVPIRTNSQIAGWINKAINKLVEQPGQDFSVCRGSTAIVQTTPGTRALMLVPADFVRFRKEKPYLIEPRGGVSSLGISPGFETGERAFGTLDGGEALASLIDGRPQLIGLGRPLDEMNTRNFDIWPLPDTNSGYVNGNYRVAIPYHKRLSLLTTAGQINWFTENAEEYIVLYAASSGFYFNVEDARGDIYMKRAAQEIGQVIARDKHEQFSGTDTLHVSGNVLDARLNVGDGAFVRGYFS